MRRLRTCLGKGTYCKGSRQHTEFNAARSFYVVADGTITLARAHSKMPRTFCGGFLRTWTLQCIAENTTILVTEKKAHEGLPGTAAVRTVIYKGRRRFCLAFSFDSKEVPRYLFSGGSTGVPPHQVPSDPGQVSVGKRQRLFCVLQRIPERVPVSDDWRSYHKGRDLGDRNSRNGRTSS